MFAALCTELASIVIANFEIAMNRPILVEFWRHVLVENRYSGGAEGGKKLNCILCGCCRHVVVFDRGGALGQSPC